MNWISPTAAHLEGVMTTYEQSLAQTGVSGSTPDRIPGIIANQVAEIRGMIATWAPNSLSATTTAIPASFLARALVLIRNTVLTGMPDYTQSAERQAETKAAEDFFSLVAKGTIRPEPAADALPSTVPPASNSKMETLNSRDRICTRDSMRGL